MTVTLAAPPAQPVLPLRLDPMLAQPAEGPLGAPEYAYEVKWDGMRVLIGLEADRISMLTRNRIEASRRFPELAALRQAVSAERAILDGEIVRLVDGRPNFGALQRRIQSSNPADIARLSRDEPCALILFDLIRDGDISMLDEPWEVRRRRLETLVQPDTTIQLSPVWPDGRVLWDTVVNLGMEGVVAKRRDSRYAPGKRTGTWLKIKANQTVDMAVGGWTEGTGFRGQTFGALMVGCYVDGVFTYMGHVGSGFSDPALLEAMRLLTPLATAECPFHPCPPTNSRAHWVRPELVCEVRYAGWTNDQKLRFPVFMRWRPDRFAGDCGRTQ